MPYYPIASSLESFRAKTNQINLNPQTARKQTINRSQVGKFCIQLMIKNPQRDFLNTVLLNVLATFSLTIDQQACCKAPELQYRSAHAYDMGNDCSPPFGAKGRNLKTKKGYQMGFHIPPIIQRTNPLEHRRKITPTQPVIPLEHPDPLMNIGRIPEYIYAPIDILGEDHQLLCSCRVVS